MSKKSNRVLNKNSKNIEIYQQQTRARTTLSFLFAIFSMIEHSSNNIQTSNELAFTSITNLFYW